MGRGPFLHASALLRFFRLFRHGSRACEDVQYRPAAQLLVALQEREYHRILEAMAHDPFSLLAGLCLYSLGREPLWRSQALPQSAADHAHRGDLARGGMDLCLVGRAAWFCPRGKPSLAVLARR